MIEQNSKIDEINGKNIEKNTEIDDFYEESVEKTKNIIDEAIAKGYTLGDDERKILEHVFKLSRKELRSVL